MLSLQCSALSGTPWRTRRGGRGLKPILNPFVCGLKREDQVHLDERIRGPVLHLRSEVERRPDSEQDTLNKDETPRADHSGNQVSRSVAECEVLLDDLIHAPDRWVVMSKRLRERRRRITVAPCLWPDARTRSALRRTTGLAPFSALSSFRVRRAARLRQGGPQPRHSERDGCERRCPAPTEMSCRGFQHLRWRGTAALALARSPAVRPPILGAR